MVGYYYVTNIVQHILVHMLLTILSWYDPMNSIGKILRDFGTDWCVQNYALEV